MRATLNIDDNILSDVISLTGKSNRSETVRITLQECLKQQKKKTLLAMRGKVDVEDNWQALRALEKVKC